MGASPTWSPRFRRRRLDACWPCFFAAGARDTCAIGAGGAEKGQRFAYPAAILTLVHWLLVHDGKTEALLHFAPLFVLQLLRIARLFTPKPLERTIA